MTITNICLSISILCFICSFLWIIYALKKKQFTTRILMSFIIAWMGAVLLPLYYIGNENATGGFFDRIVSSVLGVFRAVTGENSLQDTREIVGEFSSGLDVFIANYTAVVHLICATFLIGLILSLFKNIRSKLCYQFVRNKKLFVFSEISERSIRLAESIKNDHEYGVNHMIVFLGTINEEDDKSIIFLERINKIGAHIFDVSLIEFKIKKQYFKHKINFFLFKKNEEENLRDALELHEKYGKKIMKDVLDKLDLNAENEENISFINEVYLKYPKHANACLELLKYSPNNMIIDLMVEYEKLVEQTEKIDSNIIDGYVKQNCSQYKKLINKINIISNDIKFDLNHDLEKLKSSYYGLLGIDVVEGKIGKSRLNVEEISGINDCFEFIDNFFINKFLNTLIIYHEYRISNLGANIDFHILSTKPEAISVTDAIIYPINIAYRIINETSSLVYRLFNEQPLFLGRRDNKLKILVVGAGRIGTEAVKIASWMGQTHELKPEIIVVDSDASWIDRFEMDCPELAPRTSSKLALNESKISFYPIDVVSHDFFDILKQNLDIGYVVCALGDDERNLNASIKIRELYEKAFSTSAEDNNRYHDLIINVLFDNRFLFDISKELKFGNSVDCNLSPFNIVDEIFSWENIVNPYIDNLGKAVNRAYEADYQNLEIELGIVKKIDVYDRADIRYNDKEYGRNSSIASGLHLKNKLYSCLVEIQGKKIDFRIWHGKNDINLINECKKIIIDDVQNSNSIVEKLSILEHRRWNAYMRSQGWTYASFETLEKYAKASNKRKTHRNIVAKQTACLVDWEELDDIDVWLEKSSKDKTFKDFDRTLVKNLPDIIKQAEDLSE